MADDGAGTNDRNLHNDVVKLFGHQARQARHLRPALDLKHSNGVGLLQRGINFGIVCGKMRQAHLFAVVFANEIERILEHGHHAETEQVHFDDPQIGAIFFVPLHDDAVRHKCRLKRNDGIELSLADHHAAGMLA